MKNHYKRLKLLAREKRKDQTSCEKLLWDRIRRDQLGVRVLRQKIIGCYIADFLINKYQLIIEVDGESHIGREKEDRVRQNHLESMGYKVIRFDDHEVADDIESVVERIRKEFNPS